MILIDTGYLSWSYCAFDQGISSWNTNRFKYTDALFCLDCHPLWRKEFYSGYKSRREEKRAQRSDMLIKAERVQLFKVILQEDPLTQVVTFPRAEADDIVAALFIKHRAEIDYVIGVDKDLFQVPGLMNAMQKIDGSSLKMWTIRKSGKEKGPFPKSVRPIKTTQDFLFTQVLLGDKSDSVPRLLPLRDFDLYWRLRKSSDRWGSLLSHFGLAAEINLRLLVLPGQFMWKHDLSYAELADRIRTGQFWAEPDFFADVEIEEKVYIAQMEEVASSPQPVSTKWVDDEGDEW